MNEKITTLITDGNLSQALTELENAPQNEEVLLMSGELYHKLGRNIEALNKFNALLKISPGHKKATAYVDMINNILDYYCKDLLNP